MAEKLVTDGADKAAKTKQRKALQGAGAIVNGARLSYM
jgi:hypothetical protein